MLGWEIKKLLNMHLTPSYLSYSKAFLCFDSMDFNLYHCSADGKLTVTTTSKSHFEVKFPLI